MAPRKPKVATKLRALELVSGSVEHTQDVGERLGRALRAGDLVALRGELGSGKTTLIQGIARGLGRDPAKVKSPTFVLMREYPGDPPLIHLDGYRLEGPHAASWLDVELMFSPHKITVLEWAERFADVLPEARLEIQLSHVRTNQRRLSLRALGSRAAQLVNAVEASGKAGKPERATGREEHNAAGD